MNQDFEAWRSFLDYGPVTPYVHWQISQGTFTGEGDPEVFHFLNKDLGTELYKPVQSFAPFATDNAPAPAAIGSIGDRRAAGLSTAMASLAPSYGLLKDTVLILPSSARNHASDAPGWLPDPDRLPEPPPPDAVIVGVIDSGVPLAHRRLQYRDGTSRILAAWQQSAAFQADQPYLPFGRELYGEDIDRLLNLHRPNGRDGAVDETAFNRAAGLVDMNEPNGHRELEMRAAHGAHVIDIAAGFDPNATKPTILERVPVIAVNLPSRKVVGLSGSFLEFFIILAISRIVDLSDALCRKAVQNNTWGQRRKLGYRTLINLSFGMNAGSRDGQAVFHSFLKKLNDARKENGWRPVEVIMPAGNDNLKRGQARVSLLDNEEDELLWRILPEDRSPNYLEIWSDKLTPGPQGSVTDQFEIQVTPPGHMPLGYVTGQDGMAIDLAGGAARLYCTVKKMEDDETFRVQYVICASPTYPSAEWSRTAPAGPWRISVRNRSRRKKKIFFSIQTDQSARPNTTTGLRSYFEDPSDSSDGKEVRRYRHRDVTGRLIDTFSYEPGKRARLLDNGSRIRRHGTLNALAHANGPAVIGGYRLSDGRPADYSATGSGYRTFSQQSRGAPTCSLPSDDAPAHFGRQAAGSRDGSTVRLRGTSFATAQATRHVVLEILKDPRRRRHSANKILFDDSFSGDADVSPGGTREVDIEKVGAGRLEPPDTGYPARVENVWRGTRRQEDQ